MSLSEKFVPRTTEHQFRAATTEFDYRAIVEETPLLSSDGTVGATVHSFSYLRVDDACPQRPVMFIFNGGPGASSLYTHFGGLGPVRADSAEPPVGYHRIGPGVTNEATILDAIDLVFIDPPDTGFARVQEGKETEFFGVAQDAKAIARFIKIWLAEHNRWSSPKYLLGESYGTIRVAALIPELMGSLAHARLDAVSIDGAIMLGQAVNLAPSSCMSADAAYAMALPTFAATAWHHGRSCCGATSMEDAVSIAKAFSATEYISALYQGSELSKEKQQRLADRLEEISGLPAKLWLDANLRVDQATFAASLMADKGLWISLYDSRYTFPAPRHPFDPIADDPMLSSLAAATLVAFRESARNLFGIPHTDDYTVINFKVNGAWSFSHPESPAPQPFDLTPLLAKTLQRNPGLRLFVGSGAFDLCTVLASADHMLNHGAFPKDRVMHRTYAAGHSLYNTSESRAHLARDLRAFVTGVRPAPIHSDQKNVASIESNTDP